jgi:sarcosine oxidase
MRSEIVVVGAGVMGASTAYALARLGFDVVVLEQFTVGHKRGSSHGASRIFRLSYPLHDYVAMAQQSLPLWRALEDESGETLLTTTGGLDTGKDLDRHAGALAARGAPFEIIDGAEVTRRWPFVRIERDAQVLFQPDAGIVAADKAVAAFVKCARAAGARVAESARVERLDPKADRVDIRTSDGAVTARAVVVTAGAWARGLLGTAGIRLDTRATRETVAYFRLRDGDSPPTLVDWGSPSVYALPSPGQGLKAGEHIAGPTTDPDEAGAPDADAVGRLEAWVARRYPSAEASAHHTETCLYTNTPDEHFVLERHGRVVVGSPCSGHGFKFAPFIGRRLAALAADAAGS